VEQLAEVEMVEEEHFLVLLAASEGVAY